MNKFQDKYNINEKIITFVGILKYLVFLCILLFESIHPFRRIRESTTRKYSKRNVELPKCVNVQVVINKRITLNQAKLCSTDNTKKPYNTVNVKIDDNENGENHFGK
jgi:hypothetical protein